MLYMNEQLELVETKNDQDEGHIYQIHIPRTKESLPKFFVNKGNKAATALDKKKVLKALKEQNVDLSTIE